MRPRRCATPVTRTRGWCDAPWRQGTGPRYWPKVLAQGTGPRYWPKVLAQGTGPRYWPKVLAREGLGREGLGREGDRSRVCARHKNAHAFTSGGYVGLVQQGSERGCSTWFGNNAGPFPQRALGTSYRFILNQHGRRDIA